MNKWIDPKRLLIGAAAVAVLAVAAAVFLFYESGKEDEYINEFAVAEEEVEVQKEPEVIEDTVIKVDIKGAVSHEGVYIAAEGDRIEDIVKKAGGLTDDANPESINLAQRVEDQMVIYVMKKGEEPKVEISGQPGAAQKETEGGKININSASETELQEITGIGPSKASAIVQYREEQGPFSAIEDLMNISGIGEKTFEKMKDQVTI